MALTPARRKLGARERRESILAAAVPAFAGAGYERTRVADIAAEVGVTEPVVFQNFGTKAGLFAAVLQRAAEHVAEHLGELAGRSENVVDSLTRLLSREHQDRLHSAGGLGVIFIEAAGRAEPGIREAVEVANRKALDAIASLLRRGQAEGSIRDDVDAAALGWLVLSEIHSRQFRREHGRPSRVLEDDLLSAVIATVRQAPEPIRQG